MHPAQLNTTQGSDGGGLEYFGHGVIASVW